MSITKKKIYKKRFKDKLIGNISKNNKILFGNYGIKVLEEARLTSNQIESAKRIIIKKMKRLGFLWIRIFSNIPVTKKPTENRMGKGKGSVSFYIAKVKKGQILFEISNFSLENAQKILKAGSNKLPIKTKIISK